MASKRRERARTLVERLQRLPPEQVGRAMAPIVAGGFVAGGLQIALLVIGVRAARRGWRVRDGDARTIASSVVSAPMVLVSAGLVGCRLGHRWYVGRLLATLR